MEEDVGVSLSGLKVDGGASANDFLMQFQADILNGTVYRPKCIETTALGAAYLAGLAVGFYNSREDVIGNWQLDSDFKSNIDSEKRKALVKGWKRAIKCALAYAEED